MCTTRMLLVGALGVMLGVLSPRPAAGQFAPTWTGPRPVDGGRTALEAFYTRVGVDAGGQTTQAGGIGGRLMWALAPSANDASILPDALARRTALGVFGAYTPETRGVSTGQFGLAADVTPFARAFGGRVEPFVSLGTGVLHTRMLRNGSVVRPGTRPLMIRVPSTLPGVAPVTATSTAFLLVPSAGARVQLRPGVALQGDLRRLVTFDGGPHQHAAFSTGLRVTF